MAVLSIIAGFLSCAVTCLAFGITALRILRIELSRLECACLGYILGAAIASTIVLAAAFLWVAREATFLTLTVLALLLLICQSGWFRKLRPAPIGSIPFSFRLIFAGAWLVYGFLYFRFALAPETSPDGVYYHLGLVNVWAHAGGMSRLIDMYAALPQGMEMLYLFAFVTGGHSAAALMHFSFLMVLPLLIVLYGLRWGFSGAAAVFAAIVFLTTPLIGWDGSIAYNDVALAAATFATVCFFQLWRREKQSGLLLAAGVAAGFALAIKYTGGPVLVWLTAATAWECRRNGLRSILRVVLPVTLAAILLPAPYFVRNWIWYRNPVAFFGNSVFSNPYFHVGFVRQYIHDQAHLNGVLWRELPLNLTFGGSKLPDSLGPIYAFAPLALAGLVWPQSRLLVIAALFAALGYSENKSARFLIPALPLALLAIGYVADRIPRSRIVVGAITILQIVICWPTVVERLHTPAGSHVTEIPLKTVLRPRLRDEYLRTQVREYTMARLIDAVVPEGQPVFAPEGGVALSYTTHVIMDRFRSADVERDVDLIYSEADSVRDPRRRWTASFPSSPVRRLRIVQEGSGSADWIVNEIRIWADGSLVRANPGIHPSAFPNPWDIGLAFDGSEASFWRSWEATRPGMWIDFQFDRPQLVNRVDFVSGDAQWFSKLSLRVLNDTGRWLTVAGQWSWDPPEDLRKGATRELKREGINYIVIARDGWTARKLTDPKAWGMTLVGRTPSGELYKID